MLRVKEKVNLGGKRFLCKLSYFQEHSIGKDPLPVIKRVAITFALGALLTKHLYLYIIEVNKDQDSTFRSKRVHFWLI